MDSERDEKGVRRPSATTAMEAPERGGLLGTDKAVTTCRLPLRYRGGGTQPEIANQAWAPRPQLSSYLLLPCTKAESNLK